MGRKSSKLAHGDRAPTVWNVNAILGEAPTYR